MNILLAPVEFDLSTINSDQIIEQEYTNDVPNRFVLIGGFSLSYSDNGTEMMTTDRNKDCKVINNCNSGNCVRGCGKYQ